MDTILVHPQTQADVEVLLQRQPHAILLTGNDGSGKNEIAQKLACDLLGIETIDSAQILEIVPEKSATTIDQIRKIQHFMYLKTTGSRTIRRVVIIQQAETMTTEAQNALLKLLEEPPEDTVIILTSSKQTSLKPTIYSRVQRIHIRPITKEQAMSYAAQIGHQTHAEKAYAISGGDSVLYAALIHNYDDHDLVTDIATAKSLLSATTYERLVRVDELSKDKTHLEKLLKAMKRLAQSGLEASIQKENVAQQKRWSNTLRTIHQNENNLQHNSNTKLLLCDLFLHI